MEANLRYHGVMKLIVLIFAILSLGCTQPAIEEPTPSPAPRIKTKKKTMVCLGNSKKKVTVAIIDTGFGFQGLGDPSVLCKKGHKDFTTTQRFVGNSKIKGVPMDLHGHGTNIAGVVAKYAEGADFCLVILKYYDRNTSEYENITNTIKAINYSRQIGATIVNYSGGGKASSPEEIAAVKAYLDNGGKFIAAAGNERSDMSVFPYFPAMNDPRVIVVGSKDFYGRPEAYSNYGDRVNEWEFGTNQSGFGIVMTGTSQAAAVATGKIISRKICQVPVDNDSN